MVVNLHVQSINTKWIVNKTYTQFAESTRKAGIIKHPKS